MRRLRSRTNNVFLSKIGKLSKVFKEKNVSVLELTKLFLAEPGVLLPGVLASASLFAAGISFSNLCYLLRLS